MLAGSGFFSIANLNPTEQQYLDTGRAAYARTKAILQPVFGLLKQQRHLRQLRTRSRNSLGNEFTSAGCLSPIHNRATL